MQNGGVTDTPEVIASSSFQFDPGVTRKKLSEALTAISNPDGEIIIDTGAGRGIKPTMTGLVNPVKSKCRITWGDGTTAGSTVEATMPNHDLPPFLVTPSASCTLVSVGSNVEGTDDCYSFFDKHSFKLSGLQIVKTPNGELDARFVGPKKNRVKYIASKHKSGDVYKAPDISVFKTNSDGAWRFNTTVGGENPVVIAGPDTPTANSVHAKSAVDQVFAGMTSIQRSLLQRDLQRPDLVCACEYEVTDLNANQQRMAMQLMRKHNDLGHISRSALRIVLQQSHIKNERELARHIDLMPVCNYCLDGKNKRGHKHKLIAATKPDPAKFMENMAIDNGGKQNLQSADGYWIPMFIICTCTSFTWVRFLTTTSDSVKAYEKWLREVPKQHHTFVVKTTRHDGGRGDFGNKAFAKLLKKYDITKEQTGGTSTGNAKVERRIGISTSDSLTIMSWCRGPRNWWSHSIRYGVTTRNLAPTATNPGHMSPYESAYQRKPDYAMLVPFGCLAFALVENKKMNGKMNYRKASRTCAMLGYVLKPDGHPLAYKLYDCDLGTIIQRTDDLVKFNKDMPALKFIAERAVTRPVDIYQNATVAKYFGNTLHWGKVVSHRVDDDSELLFRIHYEDGDVEEFNTAEMMVHTRLASSKDRGHDFTVPHAPKSRKRKKLSELLLHAQQQADGTQAEPAMKLSDSIEKMSSACDDAQPSKCTSTSTSRTASPLAYTKPGKHRPSYREVRASVALGKKLFNLDTVEGTRRQLIRQKWAFSISCGAMVEPMPSDVPEIIVTPDTLASSIPVPKSYQEAVTGPYRRYWIEAIRTELENLLERKVWREEPLPAGSKPVPGKYVWKVKRTDTGTIAKWKARYIVQGFRQRAGHDYDKTFAGVANIVTIRVLLAIACELGWEVHQMDVKAAYLCSTIEDNVRMYIQCPKGYALEPGMYARLLRGLYGTKQGGALWSKLRTKVLKKLNFEQSLAEPSLYTRIRDDKRLLVACIVDDFVITGHKDEVLAFKVAIAKEWEMTDEGRLFWCLNLRVTRDMKRGLLKIDQAQYVDEILKRFNMDACNSRKTPMKEKPVLTDMCPDKPEDYDETFPYANALGCLLYLRLTRPDCLVAISILARFIKNPTKQHWEAAKDVFRYLKGTKMRGLLYRSTLGTLGTPWRVTMWVDSDYGTNPDNRRSRAGFLAYLNANLVAFNTALQRGNKRPTTHDDGIRDQYPGVKFPATAMDGEPLPSMSTGTCDAEYLALSIAVKELIWIYMLLKTMSIPIEKPCIVYEDNRATIKIAENATAMRRTKHIDIRHHFLREHAENGTIKILPIGTAEQRADVMTKVLGVQLFLRFRDIITSDIDLNAVDKRTCAHCACVFKSRNKLFRHINDCHL